MHCWRTTPALITYKESGGLAIPIFSATANSEFSRSRAATEQLMEHISNQDGTTQVDSPLVVHSKRDIGKAREEHNEAILEQLRAKMNPGQPKGKWPMHAKKGRL